MPTYEFECENCEYVWEDIMSIKDPIPSSCPDCEEEGCIRKLISLPAQGKVELTGHELKASIKEGAKQLKKEIYSNEYSYANALGESKYQEIQTKMDTKRKERPKIRSSKKST